MIKRVGLLLTLLLLFLAACTSTGGSVLEQPQGEVPGSTPQATADSADAPATGEAVPVSDEAAADDPTAVRERDWKQGNVETPAITIIEYGDFQ